MQTALEACNQLAEAHAQRRDDLAQRRPARAAETAFDSRERRHGDVRVERKLFLSDPALFAQAFQHARQQRIGTFAHTTILGEHMFV
jgi:hypothetical protein